MNQETERSEWAHSTATHIQALIAGLYNTDWYEGSLLEHGVNLEALTRLHALWDQFSEAAQNGITAEPYKIAHPDFSYRPASSVQIRARILADTQGE